MNQLTGLQNSEWFKIFDVSGKLSAIFTVIFKSAKYLNLAEVNDLLTIVVSSITAIYVAFRAYNEYLSIREKLKKKSAK